MSEGAVVCDCGRCVPCTRRAGAAQQAAHLLEQQAADERAARALEQAEQRKHAPAPEPKPLPTAEIMLVVETFDGTPTHVRISAFGRAVGYRLTNPEQTIGEAVDLAWPLLLARACGL